MQWIVPGLIEQDRWWPQKPVCYQSIAGILQNAAQEMRERHPKARYFVEKSPPNMVRHRRLVELFEDRKILVNNRDPYANISSQLSRYTDTHYRDLTRADTIAHLAEMWLLRSQYLVEIADTYDAPILTYETFCENPEKILTDLSLEDVPDLVGPVRVEVKDYDAQGISNMNARQVAQLSDADISIISKVISTRPDLLDKFGYRLA